MEDEAALKKKLIAALGSQDGRITLDAMYWLGQYGWLSDGTLKDATLTQADLNEAALQEADLRGVILDGANLYSADLFKANLESASLIKADLRETYLYGTNLLKANLRDANLKGAMFDEKLILPDGTHWTEATDMTRFTDSNHPDFWDANTIKGRHET
jgi:hypothetical protein